MNVYVCGNPLVDVDSLPMRILPLLRTKCPQISFIEFDPTETLPDEGELIIIDTVINAKEVKEYTDLDQFSEVKMVSLHDCDLGFNLKLAKKVGKLKKVKIIGVPPSLSVDVAVEEVAKLL